MRLIYSTAACSISPHIVLEEIGLPFETQRVSTKEGGTRTADYLRLNPKGKVPVLILDDGRVITENPVILQFLARAHPDSGLLPEPLSEAFEALQVCEYFCNTVHSFGLTRLFNPRAFCVHEEHHAEIRAEGAHVVAKAFALVAPRLEGASFLFDRFSIADAVLFFFEYHARRLQLAMPPAVDLHLDRLLERPSIRAVLAREGLA
ncbi:glutathione S-transferase family protein [Rhizorhabdus histidinilytica]|jgi:glutathione S-transferase|uniref:Glutathione S-transferase n=1 Tax=Rhizorhabdus histidinilytica TaxID=439228 RepID=A0A1T4ZTE1_9SPHN|nr:glutathione S-transferase N-terminal domain-containing protein [Rhizorhabdus histidinilytica]SKB25877.1 glutathione S-transferase [Rhizorhabdus histidinilytica]